MFGRHFKPTALLTDFTSLTGRVGILGGSFDPIHGAHVEIAEISRDRKQLDHVIFIPAAMNPLKSRPPASGEDRVEMVGLAIEDIPGFMVSPIEVQRTGTSYTIDTVREISAAAAGRADLFLILGSDCLVDLPRWREVETLFTLATPLMVQRAAGSLNDWHRRIDELPLSQRLRDSLKENFLDIDPINVSSTDLRARPNSAGALPKVSEYIRAGRLYRERELQP